MAARVCALMLGREHSTGFPGKNWHPLLGRPMMAYPILAAQKSETVDRIYVSTDSDRIKGIASGLGSQIIDRPAELATAEALGEDAYAHGYRVVRDELAETGDAVEVMVLLFANAPTVTGELIDRAVVALRENPELDSAVSVSRYNMWSPLRARRIGDDGLLHPAVPFEVFGDPDTMNCDRDSQGDIWFADMSVSVVRPHCLERLEQGLLPQRWMGQRIHPIPQEFGCDVDYEWQLPLAEHYLRRYGDYS